MSVDRPEGRSFGLLEHFALWATLSASLYIMPFGSHLVPAMSIERALLATAVAAFIAGLLIAAIATASARTGMSTLELIAAPFGTLASAPLALLLLVRNVAFAAFALSFMAEAASVVSDRALGEALRPVWVIAFGLLAWILIRMGPELVVSRVLRRGGVWIVLLLAVVIAGSAYMEFEVPSYLKRPAVGGWPSFWQGVDIMLVVPLLWLPIVADFARFGKDTRSAGMGSFLGVFVMTLWFGALGIVYLPAVESGDVSGFVVGMNMSLGAVVLPSSFKATRSLPMAPQPRRRWSPASQGRHRRRTALLVTAAAILVALPGTCCGRGDVPAPWFALRAAIRRCHRRSTRRPRCEQVRPGTLLAWATDSRLSLDIATRGAVVAGRDQVVVRRHAGPPLPLTDEVTWLGAAVPSFLAAFAVQLGGAAFLAFVNPASGASPVKEERSG
jgi:hypothetical protein